MAVQGFDNGARADGTIVGGEPPFVQICACRPYFVSAAAGKSRALNMMISEALAETSTAATW